jgi:hypothetical protein
MGITKKMAELRKRNRFKVVVPDLAKRWENAEYEND